MPLLIILIAVIGVVILQAAGAIPPDPVGAGLVMLAVMLVATVALAVHDAWTNKVGVLGWIVNIVVSFLGAFFAAQIAGPVVAIPLLMLAGGGSSSVAGAGEGLMSVALVLVMAVALGGSWGALWLVNRARSRRQARAVQP